MYSLDLFLHNNSSIRLNTVSYFKEVNLLDKAWKILAVMGVGYASWMIYKKYNPECVHDIKTTIDKVTQKASKSIENMM